MTQIPLQNTAIYDGIETLGFASDRQTWSSGIVPEFEEIIRTLQPKVAIEVGSWKGVSACRIAAAAGPGCTVYCVDTWLGSLEHHTRTDRNYKVLMSRGLPLLYFQFLVNVKDAGFHNQIVPIPNTSAIGARILQFHGVMADFIFVDGSHDERDAVCDMADYWALLRPGGKMLVDDYTVFPGVGRAVQQFADTLGLKFEVVADGTFALFTK